MLFVVVLRNVSEFSITFEIDKYVVGFSLVTNLYAFTIFLQNKKAAIKPRTSPIKNIQNLCAGGRFSVTYKTSSIL